MGLGVAFGGLAGCETEGVSGPVPSCDLEVDAVEPARGPMDGGTEVTVTGTFVAGEGERDVQVRVGSVDAEVLGTTSTGCDPCFACANEALLCATCDRFCRGLDDFTSGDGTVFPAETCVETVTFATPPGDTGAVAVVILNSNGSTDDITFTYEPAGDDDDSAGDDDDSAGDDDDSAGDDDDSAGDDDDSAGDDDDSAGDDDDSAR